VANKQISEGRQTAYYLGTGLIVIGFLTFGSVFVTVALGLRDAGRLGCIEDPGNIGASFALRAIGGMALMILGTFLRTVGQCGLAGSGSCWTRNRRVKMSSPGRERPAV